MSAWADPARPSTAAVRPLTISVAIPKLFISIPSSAFGPCSNLLDRTIRLNIVFSRLIPLAEIDRQVAGMDQATAPQRSPSGSRSGRLEDLHACRRRHQFNRIDPV